jgi:hypothetical protein
MTSAKKLGMLLLIMGVVAAAAGMAACQKKAETAAETAEAQPAATVFEGPVKTAYGKYMYVPAARGFDIAAQDFDTATLIDKDVRVKGEVLPDKPSVFRADSIEVKDASGAYSTVYTRTADLTMEDFLDVKAREGFAVLTLTSANKPEEWENKGQVKIYGKILATTVKQGQEETPVTYIVVNDEAGKEVGKIIVDSETNFARYYLQKLRLFDSFWFYINGKETVDRRVRVRSKELFHADLLFAGLF